MADLKQNVAPDKVLTDLADLQKHENDAYGVNTATGLPLAFIKATSVADIQGVLKTARKFHIPVVPQTTATSTVSGSDAIANSLFVDRVHESYQDN